MFFQNFFGTFTNNYAASVSVTQTATISIGLQTVGYPYIGNEYLPVGENPWIIYPETAQW